MILVPPAIPNRATSGFPEMRRTRYGEKTRCTVFIIKIKVTDLKPLEESELLPPTPYLALGVSLKGIRTRTEGPWRQEQRWCRSLCNSLGESRCSLGSCAHSCPCAFAYVLLLSPQNPHLHSSLLPSESHLSEAWAPESDDQVEHWFHHLPAL